jgi:pimeloyl-ACP methyl ester carboxylesterase
MIAQHVSAAFPDRVLSLTSVMSTTGNRQLPSARRDILAKMVRRPASGDPEAAIEYTKSIARLIGSPGYPLDEARLDSRVRAEVARSASPAGYARQLVAIAADGDRRTMLRGITVPTLVIHGEDDALVPIACGRDTAANVPDSQFLAIPGMGHDLPLGLVDTLADAITAHAGGVAAR